ncbi:thiolase family protein [Moorella sp. Hama-1]|uniref:thiolase family protein n=1 Tax=Moorella sp. Hama-1 TaxID=2138101 RepID=UPI000D654096|nr:thiolase family protein [Moorella sp. Hama-1]BCV21388.1 acetyl-CoA acetyltransferase [Moorella sp. Hama-1]
MDLKSVVIVSGARTAVGRFNGSLKDFKAAELGAIVIKEAVKRANIDPAQVDEVVMGCVGQVAEDAFLARVAAIKAGLPVESPAMTINRLCSSGVQAIVLGAMEIAMGFADIVVAGGAESMTNLPFYLRKSRFGYVMGHGELEDGLITALSDPFTRNHMGITAENVAEKHGITREEQDAFAFESQRKAALALKSGIFNDEVIPIKVKCGKNEERVFDTDEHPRPDTTLEKLAKLRPAFKKDGTVTAGNASGINDGAAAVVMMTEEKAKELGLKPIVRLVSAAVAGVPPEIMGIGPIPAVRKLLKRTGIKLDDIGLIELNEAFASQAIACIRELELDISKVNVNGGAIAFGHPIGATGAILTVKLMNDMVRKGVRYGLETLCIGGGQGLAVLYELM